MEIKNLLKNIDSDKYIEKTYHNGIIDYNNLSYWYTKLVDGGFFDYSDILTPKTQFFNMDKEWFKWLTSDSYSDSDIKLFNEYILKNVEYNDNKKYFIKTGNFSNKFDFNTCTVSNRGKIGESFLDVFYSGMCVGAKSLPTVVLREYIDSSSDYYIYNGMPLRYEFRFFYDFDESDFIGVAKYWHEDEMKKTVDYLGTTDLDKLLQIKNIINNDNQIESIDDYITYCSFKHGYGIFFKNNKRDIANKLSKNLNRVKIGGKWSIDIMIEGDKTYLIDMALMENSALSDKIETI